MRPTESESVCMYVAYTFGSRCIIFYPVPSHSQHASSTFLFICRTSGLGGWQNYDDPHSGWAMWEVAYFLLLRQFKNISALLDKVKKMSSLRSGQEWMGQMKEVKGDVEGLVRQKGQFKDDITKEMGLLLTSLHESKMKKTRVTLRCLKERERERRGNRRRACVVLLQYIPMLNCIALEAKKYQSRAMGIS